MHRRNRNAVSSVSEDDGVRQSRKLGGIIERAEQTADPPEEGCRRDGVGKDEQEEDEERPGVCFETCHAVEYAAEDGELNADETD